jgi:CMP-N-acetylneuraminic acid synthetase
MSLAGTSLVGWSVKAAMKSRSLSRVIVSTDDPEIARAARRSGGDVPFRRPRRLATDKASIVGVLQHAVGWLQKAEGIVPDVVVLLQATSPFRSGRDIDETVALVVGKGADSAETVALDERHPFYRYYLKRGRLVPWRSAMHGSSRRQDHKPIYRPTGAVYAVRTPLLMGKGLLRGRDHRGVVRGERASIDIDTVWDFELARRLARKL